MQADIVLLPGDGIGPEIIEQAERVIEAIAVKFNHQFTCSQHAIGGVAIDQTGDPLPPATVDACKQAQAVLLGAVGGPKWDDPNAKTRPEKGLLEIRKELNLFANLRPIAPFPELLDSSPLRREIIEGTDILFVRELTGGIYFGPSSSETTADDQEIASSTMIYSTAEIERIVRLAAKSAVGRRNKLTMVDKANVLEASRLWRRVSARVMAEEFPEVDYDVVLVDAMAMHLISRPRDFDVVVTSNLFGDILTDEASMLPGSMGMLPSASIGGDGPGLFEPIHGSAPDIAGQGVANPMATILALAMLFRHSLGLENEAATIESAVQKTLAAGHRTADIAPEGVSPLSTTAVTDKILTALGQQ